MTSLLPDQTRSEYRSDNRRSARSAARERMASVLAERVPGRPLPSACYTDPELHALDLELLWGRQWFFAGTTAEIPEAGDYVTISLGSRSVIVMRDDDEQPRAFHNVCRHRGARLVDQAAGSVGNLVCGYHKWTYGTDGRLLHAPGLPPGEDPACLGLRQVHLREIAGLIFLCFAADPPADIEDAAAALTPYFAPHGLASAKVATQIDVIEDGNWKLTMENNRECYHCEGHPDLICTFFPTWGLREDQVPPRLRASHDRYLLAEADLIRACEEQGLPFPAIDRLIEPSAAFRVERTPLDGAGESFSRDGSRLVQRLLGSVDEPRLGRLGLHSQPNAWFHVLSDHAVTFAVLPVAVDKTLVRTTWLVDADAVEGVDYDLDDLTRTWRHTNEEDAAFVALAQQGVADPAYEPGPYTESEGNVDAFVQWYLKRMTEELAR